jgi:hypothetical protein
MDRLATTFKNVFQNTRLSKLPVVSFGMVQVLQYDKPKKFEKTIATFFSVRA